MEDQYTHFQNKAFHRARKRIPEGMSGYVNIIANDLSMTESHLTNKHIDLGEFQ